MESAGGNLCRTLLGILSHGLSSAPCGSSPRPTVFQWGISRRLTLLRDRIGAGQFPIRFIHHKVFVLDVFTSIAIPLLFTSTGVITNARFVTAKASRGRRIELYLP